MEESNYIRLLIVDVLNSVTLLIFYIYSGLIIRLNFASLIKQPICFSKTPTAFLNFPNRRFGRYVEALGEFIHESLNNTVKTIITQLQKTKKLPYAKKHTARQKKTVRFSKTQTAFFNLSTRPFVDTK